MQIPLKSYQQTAVRDILRTLERSKKSWHDYHEHSAFALSAPTSSGKTVIAAAAIEATLHGSDEFDIEADPTAVFLWVSKDPALNEQTKARFHQHADRIPPNTLITLDKDFTEESLKPGNIYFINPQKLAISAGFVKYTDTRSQTFWDILANTIKNPNRTLYMVLDEAHEGMRPSTKNDQTIVMRMINGNGIPAMPVVWGISATVQRFDKAMANTSHLHKRPNITIDPLDVQASGLIKTSIHLDIPNEDGEFTTTLVRDAARDFVDVCHRWDEYTKQQGIEEPVSPLLVVQIPNRPHGQKDTTRARQEEGALIASVLTTIREEWPDLPDDGIAHVLGEGHGAIHAGRYLIPRIEPQLIQGQQHIRVLIAKDAISTGWDCPRAEVLVSLRPGKDPTYVTQLIGRMVRTPLAQSTNSDRLNSAACYLPKFDLTTTKAVVDELLGKSKESSKASSTTLVQKILLKPITLTPNIDVPVDSVDLISSLPSYAKPSPLARPIKRLLKAAQAFGQDKLVEEPDRQAHETLFGVLDGIAATHAAELEACTYDILTANILRIKANLQDGEVVKRQEKRIADTDTVDDVLRRMRRTLTSSIVNGYIARDAEAAIKASGTILNVDINSVRARVAALSLLELDKSIQSTVEEAADTLTRHWLNTNAGKISNLTDSRRAVYEELRQLARYPELTNIEIPKETQVDTVDGNLKKLQVVSKHIISDNKGEFPLPENLNRWERTVIRKELQNEKTVSWYRNPSVASRHSLRIAYQVGDTWKSVQPDLIFVAEDDTGKIRPSIIDPHGSYLGDSHAKLKALTEYADRHGNQFERILAIGLEKDYKLIGLDLLDPSIRAAVYSSNSDMDSIDELFETRGKVYTSIE